VAGVGGMGSSICYQLAKKGFSVLGLEQFEPVHDLGSSHGETRIIRKAYFEDPRYVPLVLRSYELWKELEQESGEKLLNETGCLILGLKDSPVLRGCLKSADKHNLPHELFQADQLREKFPQFKVDNETMGFYEPEGGYLKIEKCVDAFIKGAINYGAQLNFNEGMDSYNFDKEGVTVKTSKGEYAGKKLILSQGAWSEGDSLPLQPKRVLLYWFDYQSKFAGPVYFQEINDSPWIYGFPPIDGELKVAFHNHYEDCHPDSVNREISPDEISLMEPLARKLLPELGEYKRSKVCMYTMTPDEHFILGPWQDPRLFLAAGFSGHGYKFSAVVGEIAREFVEGHITKDIGFLSPARFN